ncbi:MAG: alkaline phosphatase family protein [Candidatus Omnitrophica bacterium]|nr:alkaline phosphatase family protein [Candidatus Omnitrophota bacterium]
MIFLGYIDPGSGFVIATGIGGFLAAIFGGFLGGILLFFKRIFKFLKDRRKATRAILAFLLTVSICAGVVMNMNGSDYRNRLIILGFDGLSPDMLEPLMAGGELPNFAKLKDEGSYTRMSSTNPPQSPVAWTGFATGKNPGKNGLYDFIVRDPMDYSLKLSMSDVSGDKARKVVKAKRIWDYATDKKIPAVILNCPVTFPPDRMNGRMLSGMGVPDILGTEGTFTYYTTEDPHGKADTGGKVFYVPRPTSHVPQYDYDISLIGPKFKKGEEVYNFKVPVKVQIKDAGYAIAEFQKKKVVLKTGEWSPWQAVTFDIVPFRKAKGIFRFYLREANSGFKLYVSPINFDPRDPLFPISYPKDYSREIAEKIGLYHTQGMPMDTWALNEGRLEEKPFMEMMEEVLSSRKKLLDMELARTDRGVVFAYFESTDIVQHMFFRYNDPESPLYVKDGEKYRDMIKDWYKKMDRVLGEVMKKRGKDDTLIVLSDHGFTSFRRAAHLNSWLRQNGYLELIDPYQEEGGELLADIDWKKTKAYSIGFGAIYINQEGRERDGIVKPGIETEKLKDEISGKLGSWVDAKTNCKVVSQVYKKEEIFWGPFTGEMPDLYAGFNNGYRASWQTAIGATPKTLLEDNMKKWSGDHLVDPALVPAVLFTNTKITKKDPSILDITPTVMKMIGYTEKEIEDRDLDGTPLF